MRGTAYWSDAIIRESIGRGSCRTADVDVNKYANALIYSGENVVYQILGRRYPAGTRHSVLFWHSSLFVGKSCCSFALDRKICVVLAV